MGINDCVDRVLERMNEFAGKLETLSHKVDRIEEKLDNQVRLMNKLWDNGTVQTLINRDYMLQILDFVDTSIAGKKARDAANEKDKKEHEPLYSDGPHNY